MNVLVEKFKEVLYSVLPIVVIVMLLNFTIVPLTSNLLVRFIIGSVFIIIGLAIFLFGVDIGITPMGNHMGATLAKSNKLITIIFWGFVLGFFISIAEPDLHILAEQVNTVTNGLVSKVSIVGMVSLGIALMLTVGLLRILFNIPLYKMLIVIYLIILGLSFFASSEFLAIAFDASGATTGAMTVPFILALSIGISNLKKDSKASEKDSFGLVAITSSGAIITVLIMSMIKNTEKIEGTTKVVLDSISVIESFLVQFPKVNKEVFLALLPLVIIFIIFDKISFKLSKKAFVKILKGFVYAFIGLVLFLIGVNAGLMDVARYVGINIAALDKSVYSIVIGFLLGFVTILAEPAVYVLTHQVEDVTSGYVKRKSVLISLAIGVGIAIALSVIRVLVPSIKLWHYLLPGYILAMSMTFFCPKLFVGIAFDSGGVASGPMTATFILAFIQGIASETKGANVLIDGLGMIAMVALAPLITIQILGLIFKIQSEKRGLESNGNLSE